MTAEKLDIYSLFMDFDKVGNLKIPLSEERLSIIERKILIDGLVDPVFVIANANLLLMKKLEKFVDAETRENFYMIDRAQKKLMKSINQLRYNPNSIE